MKSLLISLSFMFICVIPWCIYDASAYDTLNNAEMIIIREAMPIANDEDFTYALKKINILKEDWNNYKNYASFFVNRQQLNDVDDTLSKVEQYIIACDKSNTLAELSCLYEQISYLRKSEELHLSTIL